MAGRRASSLGGPSLLARLRVGTKLLVLALLPVACLLGFAAVSGVSQWREARRLDDFRTAGRISVVTAGVADALQRERIAAVLARLRPDAASRASLAGARRATDRALKDGLRRAQAAKLPVDAAGRIDAADRQRDALVLQTEALDIDQIAAGYGSIVHDLLNTVAALDAGRPTRASGRAADAYVAISEAIEAAARERVDVAALLGPSHPRPTASRWEALEAAELDAFRQTATGPLRVDLEAVLFSPAGIRTQHVRERLADAPQAAVRETSLDAWVRDSGTRIEDLRALAGRSARSLGDAAAHDLAHARTRAWRDLALSLIVLAVVTALALALRRSITGPLHDVSEGARTLSSGELTFDIRYAGVDEIGAVAGAFRELQVTAARLAGEIRAMNTAVRENRLDHRADLERFEGTWAALLGGMNDTMAAFSELQDRRARAERETTRIFDLSLDLLAIARTDGYFVRVNPAFERTLGYSSEELLARPLLEFVHPDDRERTRGALEAQSRGREVINFEDRYICADGSIRWLQWNGRPVPEEGLIYAGARDVTELRRAAAEQAALRRVATLVAQAVPPEDLFCAVATEVDQLLETRSAKVLRYDGDGLATVLGTANGDSSQRVAPPAAGRAGGTVTAPILVRDRPWGAISVSSGLHADLPPDAEARLENFTGLVATAIANAASRSELAASRARVVSAADDARRRIERDLHDGVQQRLVGVALQLREAEVMAEDAPPEVREQLSRIAQNLASTVDDLREMARGIHPAILSRGGLGPALRTLARRSAVPVELEMPAELDLPDPVEVAAYYVVSEALTNAAKHAGASVVEVVVAGDARALELTIRDDGVGGATRYGHAGSGLMGLTDRVEALGGVLRLESPAGRGTTLRVTIPLDVARAAAAPSAAPQRAGRFRSR